MSTDTLTCGYLPPGIDLGSVDWVIREVAGAQGLISLGLPRLTPAQLRQLGAHLQVQARERLHPLPVLDIVAGLDRCIADMLRPRQPLRMRYEPALLAQTGYDAEMLRLGINECLRTFRRPELLRMLCEDLGDPGLLDGFRPRVQGGWTRAYGPVLLGQVWAGNVPGIPLWGMAACLLAKGATLGKLASAEPVFASWFAHSLAQVAPELAQALAVVWWPGGDTDSESALLDVADVMMVYGGDETLRAWQVKVPPHIRFLPHGHKFSVALLAASALDTRQAAQCARLAARDVTQWDQQACYAPQTIYVERGGAVSPRDFALLLAGELAALARRHRRKPLDLAEKTQLAKWRQSLSMRALRGEALELMGPLEADWAVAYLDEAAAPEASATHRSVCVVAADSLADAVSQLQPFRRYLQTAAVAARPEALFDLAGQLAAVGVNRVCALGATASPQSGWHHDGRFSLLDLLRLADIEASAETLAQDFASYRD